MSNSRDYYHSTHRGSTRGDADNSRQLPSLHNVVGDAYRTTSSAYNYQDVRRSLPPVSHYPGYDRQDHTSGGPRLPPIYPDSASGHDTYSAYSSTRSSTRQQSHTSGNTASGSSRANADYPSNYGHSFQTFYASGRDLVPMSSPSTRPQGMVRTSDIPEEDNDPRKRYKCQECGKGFDRPSGLETHSHRHSGDRPYACPAPGCDKSFGVKSNMTRHYREQHEEREDDDRHTTRHSTYSFTSRGASGRRSPPSEAFYSSSRR